MKIDTSAKSVGGLSSSASTSRSAKTPQTSSAASEGDKVQLSSLSSRLQQMAGAMANTPIVDTAKVAEVKQAMSEGKFQVHPEKIADSLIQSVQQMLQGQIRTA